MEDYNKIIESLGVRFIKAKQINVVQPIAIDNFYDVENRAILVNKGAVGYGEAGREKYAKKGEVLFVPGGKSTRLVYGEKPEVNLTNDEFISRKELYVQAHTDTKGESIANYSYIGFEAKVFNSVNFFASLDVDPFVIKSTKINDIIRQILAESETDTPGRNRVIKLKTEHLVIEVVRYIIENNQFVEQLATNSTYFKDPRLIDIFNYIKENLSGNLSNKVLAGVANVSEDYVGQYFKMLTGINLQDYIEYQRMEEAVNLMRTTKKSIRDIGHMVGYKDTAYFCRRFKMMFGIPAGKMRRRESLMNI
ncbi:MAG TPA: AraC family transcriptional regulator [Flammeovirgaceae bacterium]|nr:AraC family transcriptional regulator [Flammeovirgaceae bacterium]